MKYLKIYENFMFSINTGIAADLEASEMENDQIYSEMTNDNFGTEESQFGTEEILSKWEDAFGDRAPTTQEKYDFYHDLRQEGFDGILIVDTLGDKMNNGDEICDDCNDDNCCTKCNCKPCECK
jgi:hypothetical protein